MCDIGTIDVCVRVRQSPKLSEDMNNEHEVGINLDLGFRSRLSSCTSRLRFISGEIVYE